MLFKLLGYLASLDFFHKDLGSFLKRYTEEEKIFIKNCGDLRKRIKSKFGFSNSDFDYVGTISFWGQADVENLQLYVHVPLSPDYVNLIGKRDKDLESIEKHLADYDSSNSNELTIEVCNPDMEMTWGQTQQCLRTNKDSFEYFGKAYSPHLILTDNGEVLPRIGNYSFYDPDEEAVGFSLNLEFSPHMNVLKKSDEIDSAIRFAVNFCRPPHGDRV